MGYDMHWVEEPEEIRIATRAARDRALKANEVANQRIAGVKARKPDARPPMPFGIPNPPGEEPDEELVKIEKERMAAWDELDRVERSYFRLNIWGMDICRRVMAEHGMTTNRMPEEASFSRVPELVGEWEDHFDDEDDPITEFGRVHRQRQEEALSAVSTEPGIGVWKLCSNDGWHVTPDEINAALLNAPESAMAFSEQLGKNVEIGWWPDWLRFLREAATEGGGFRVY